MPKKKEPRFTKAQLKACAQFRERRDLIEALLRDGENYTKGEAEKRIEQFLKGRVK